MTIRYNSGEWADDMAKQARLESEKGYYHVRGAKSKQKVPSLAYLFLKFTKLALFKYINNLY